MNKETISVMVFPYQGQKDTSPNYKITAKIGNEFVDVGWGWKKMSAKQTPFLSLSLDADGLKKVYKDKYDKLTSAGNPIPFEPINDREAEISPDDVFNNF